MTTIDFYTHVDDRLAVAARIVAKAYAAHGSVRVLTPDAPTTDALDRLLWISPAIAFLPHCRMDSAVASETPIWIDERMSHDGPAAVLVNLQRDPPPFFSRFERLAEIVGHDEDDAAAGRERYKFYRERGYELRVHNVSALRE
jgi:DNA polymerase-3 subunit chi